MDKRLESGFRYLAEKTGYETTESLRFLHNLIKCIDPYCVLELGTAWGASAVYMASALSNSNSILISIDDYNWRNAKSPDEVKLEIDKLGYGDRIVLIKGNTHNARALMEQNELYIAPEVLFMDADHSYKGLVKEFASCMPFLSENHIIVVDDVMGRAGSSTFVAETIRKYIFMININQFHNGMALFCNTKEYFDGINAAIGETLND